MATGQIRTLPVGTERARLSWLRTALRFTRRYPVIPGVVLLTVLVLPAMFAEFLAPHDPVRGEILNRLQPGFWAAEGSWDHILGTDRQGRDVLSRMIFGARISLLVSLSALFIAGLIGTTLGLVAGYFGGWVDMLIMRVVDTALSIPLILLALTLVVVFDPSIMITIFVVALLLWARYARQIRAEVLSIRHQDFVARAVVSGASNTRIILKHILPNVVNTLIVLATLQIGVVILLEATLSFLGAGIPRTEAAWGVMVAGGRDYISTAWWISLFPGLAILFTVLSMNLLGDWLRDHLDPKLRQL